MALSANTVWEIQTPGTIGADDNGGGFVTGASGSDYSQAVKRVSPTESVDISTTDAVANGTTTLTSATANFGTTIVGNIICLSGGSGALTKVWRQVTARASTSSITLDAAVAAGTGITMNIGGPLASIGMVSSTSAAVGGNLVYIKAGSYTISSATGNISGGTCSRGGVDISFIGYNTVRGDMGTAPVLTASGISSFTVFTVGTANSIQANLSIDCASLTSGRGFLAVGTMYQCKVVNSTNSAFATGGAAICIRCEATGCATAGAAFNAITTCIECNAHDNTRVGFNEVLNCVRCIADTCTGTTDGFVATSGPIQWSNCVTYACGRDGFRIGAAQAIIENCIAEDNVAVGFNGQNNNAQLWRNNAAFSNGTDFSLGTGKSAYNLNSVTGSNSFFTDAANGDFSLNNTAGGGASARAAGYPGVFPGGLSTGYLDIGTIQHQDGGGGGGGTHAAVF